MNTPTPETDAAVTLTFAAGHNTVCPNFARKLEHQRDQLRKEFNQFVDHFKCFEHTSSDPSDKIAFERAREVLK